MKTDEFAFFNQQLAEMGDDITGVLTNDQTA